LDTELDHSSLQIDTLTIDEISGINYLVAPNLGSNEKLYLGIKDDLEIPITFIQIPLSNPNKPNYWTYPYDSTITIDSLRFIIFSKDSLLTQSSTPNLYFSPDSQFDENKSNYLDFQNFSLSGWFNLGQPNINIKTDTSTLFLYTELIWDIDTLIQSLSDTLDSNLVRTFAIKLTNSDTNFIELFSEEATTGDRDPQIIMYYKQVVLSEDTTLLDKSVVNIYSDGDLSIFEPSEFSNETNSLILSNGRGLRFVLNLFFPEDTLPVGSLIRSADLFLPTDSINNLENYSIIIDPIEVDSSVNDSISVYTIDPYNGIGFPYRVTGIKDTTEYIFSIKNILQNILLGNEINLGFKVVADEKNNPFDYVLFDLNHNLVKARLEIIYVYN